MASIDLSGMGVALVTPFRPDKTIDYDSLARLLDYQIESGVAYMVVRSEEHTSELQSP